MAAEPIIAVVCGGISREREVSLGSGLAVAEAFEELFQVERIVLDEEILPSILEKERHVVFSTLHGTFGEDGGFQALLESAGIEYAGCDRASSEITFDKVKTKAVLAQSGIPIAPQITFKRGSLPDANEVFTRLGQNVVLKPSCQGSSVGLGFARTEDELSQLFQHLEFDDWMLETLIEGREISVGVVDGRVLEIVEIRPKSGQFDYESKYTKGLTEYIPSAFFPPDVAVNIKNVVSETYSACGCRDYARIDLMVDAENRPFVLEVNTLPGMKETSLLPMSAEAAGLNFKALLKTLVSPAILRFQNKYSTC